MRTSGSAAPATVTDSQSSVAWVAHWYALSLIDAALNGKTRAIVRDSESTVAFYRRTHGLKD